MSSDSFHPRAEPAGYLGADPFSSDVPPGAAAPGLRPVPIGVPLAAPLAAPLKAPSERLTSLDAYRGLVMVLMISAGLYTGAVVKGFDRTPGWEHLKTPAWTVLAYQTDHPEWAAPYRSTFDDYRAWGAVWDQIQSSFMFMVGAALAFSLASRRAKGQSFKRTLWHALVRSAVLVLLSVLLASNRLKGTNWSFTIVLAQIGLGYPFLFLLAWLRPRWQLLAALLVLVGYWAAFALYPAPRPNLNLASVGLPDDWHRLQGFASHWEKNTNWAAAVDRWFLNLFPRPTASRSRSRAGATRRSTSSRRWPRWSSACWRASGSEAAHRRAGRWASCWRPA